MTILGEWKRIGCIGVDSGHVIVADPGYLLHERKPHKALGKNWDAFLASVERAKRQRGMGQLRFDKGHDGLAVVVNTFQGDGIFEVWGRFSAGECFEVRVTFDGTFCQMGGEPGRTCEVRGCHAAATFACDAPVKAGKWWRDCNRAVCRKHVREPRGDDGGWHACPEHGERLRAPARSARKASKT